MTSDTRPAPGLHVEPTASGRWVVCYEHHTAAALRPPDGKRGARVRAAPAREPRASRVVLLHDCYARVHEITPSA